MSGRCFGLVLPLAMSLLLGEAISALQPEDLSPYESFPPWSFLR
jgi:hypothetical protein